MKWIEALLLVGLSACATPSAIEPVPGASWAERPLEALGSPDIDERSHAEEELAKKLPDVEALLRANKDNPDAEIAARCRALLARLEKPARVVVGIKVGKVALVDEKVSRVATDLRIRDGVFVGQRLYITHFGTAVGELEIIDVQQW